MDNNTNISNTEGDEMSSTLASAGILEDGVTFLNDDATEEDIFKHLSKEKFEDIIQKHQLWLAKKEGGERADFSECDLRWLNTEKSELKLPEGASLERADFTHSLLEGADLEGLNVSGAIFKDALMQSIHMNGASAKEAEFSNAKLDWANFYKANLEEASFDKASLGAAILKRANLRGAIFSEAMLVEATLSDCDATDANFYRAVLGAVYAEGMLCAGASFMEANLAYAKLSRVQLTTAKNIAYANFQRSTPRVIKIDNQGFYGAPVLVIPETKEVVTLGETYTFSEFRENPSAADLYLHSEDRYTVGKGYGAALAVIDAIEREQAEEES